MKWHKYTEQVARNPIVAACLDDVVGPQMLHHGGTHPEFTLQQWVERQLEYVAVRPWESLDMNVLDASSWNAQAAHMLYYHIGGEERVCSRMRWLTDADCNLRSLAQVMRDVVEWYGLYWAKQPDRPLVFDAVVRKSSYLPDGKRYFRETANIWLAPEGYQPTI